ncbi:MAG: hypothetical protein QG640_288 [Patescibacteria group bacterium]|nr:hypothetical protein [Patescibacteria group bacterium]
MKKKTQSNAKVIAAAGAGVLALAAASYYLFGPEAKKHQKKVKGWMIKAKGEIIEKLEDAKEMTEPVYHSIVDSVTTAYLKNGKIAKEDIEAFTKNLKGQWKSIAKSASPKKAKTKSKK